MELKRLGQMLASRLLQRPRFTYFRLHLAYFLAHSLLGAILFWATTRRSVHLSYLDSIYAVVSANCLSGLSVVPIESVTTGGQILLMLFMILGGQVSTSLVPLLVRKRTYCRVAADLVQMMRDTAPAPPLPAPPPPPLPAPSPPLPAPSPPLPAAPPSKAGSKQLGTEPWMRAAVPKILEEQEHGLFLLRQTYQEYLATELLIKVVLIYFLAVHAAGFGIAWICVRRLSMPVNTAFFSIFAVISAFANCGYVLNNNNIVPFANNIGLELDLAALILLGNTLYPAALRAIIWTVSRADAWWPASAATARFLMHNPRSCYTHLFPVNATTWLLISAVCFHSFTCAVLYILDWNNLPQFNAVQKLVNGVFMSANTRSGGMNSINLVALSPAVLFIFIVMMYIAAYPVFLSRQHSRFGASRKTTLLAQAQRLLARDSAYLCIAIFLISAAENKNLKRDPLNFNIFNIVFEVISAYGNGGMSMGYSCALRIDKRPCVDRAVSFSGMFGNVGKLVIIVVMLLGRHRGLPEGIDPAIQLPSSMRAVPII